jgi:hypothetical protein
VRLYTASLAENAAKKAGVGGEAGDIATKLLANGFSAD